MNPTPCMVMQPQIITLPPPCFTVCLTCCLIQGAPFFFHTQDLPSDWIQLILTSSENITHSQSSLVQCWYFSANSRRCLRWLTLRRGLGAFTMAPIFSFLSAFQMVWWLT